MNVTRLLTILLFVLSSCLVWSQSSDKPATVASASTVSNTWGNIETDFTSAANAMPEDKYSFVPSAGEFKGARSFAQQVLQVACASFAFFKEFEGKQPDEACSYNGPPPKKTKAEIMNYLRQSFKYAAQVMATRNPQDMLAKVEGPYGGPSNRCLRFGIHAITTGRLWNTCA